MRKTFLLFVCMLVCCTAAFPQTVTLTFTAQDTDNHYVQLDRVMITNLTKGWQETVDWPDTILTMQNGTGINDIVGTNDYSSLLLSQNNPNPFIGTTEVSLIMATEGTVILDITDINGRSVVANDYSLQSGSHQFRIILATAGTYVMTARQNGQTSTIKMVCNGGGDGNKMEYVGTIETPDRASLQLPKSQNTPKYATTYPFNFGDEMEFVGYAIINGTELESAHVNQMQNASETIVLTFTVFQNHDAEPCRGSPTVTDIDGNIYNTVMIGTQCWMKENLRTTRYSNGTSITLSSNTSTTTAYRCYPNDNASNVPTYGYLYNWPAVMGTSTSSDANPSGVQGICPTGWHVPSYAEWLQLTNYVSSQSQYVCGDNFNNIGKALASTTGWESYEYPCYVGNDLSTNNATGFSALPAGDHLEYYLNFSYNAIFWSATEQPDDFANNCMLTYFSMDVWLGMSFLGYGLSVRCVRD